MRFPILGGFCFCCFRDFIVFYFSFSFHYFYFSNFTFPAHILEVLTRGGPSAKSYLRYPTIESCLGAISSCSHVVVIIIILCVTKCQYHKFQIIKGSFKSVTIL